MTVTTIKLRSGTRDRLRSVSRQLEATYDETIDQALAALGREQRRQRMRQESLELMRDPEDRAEMRRVRQEMDALRAGVSDE